MATISTQLKTIPFGAKTITLLIKCADSQPLKVAFSMSTLSEVSVIRLRPSMIQMLHVTVDDEQ